MEVLPPISRITAYPAEENAIEHLYDVTYMETKTIRVTLTKHPDVVTEWISGVDTRANSVTHDGITFLPVGFALEFDNTTSFGRGRIGTVELYVGNRCLVIQLPDASAWCPSLNEFLGHHRNFFFGVFMAQKVKMLKKQFPSVPRKIAIAELAPDFVVEHADKERVMVSMTVHNVVENDWARPGKLSDAQVHYACTNAFLNRNTAFCLWRF